MQRLSLRLKGYGGGNPFHESQAKTFGDEKLVGEFYPIPLFWSLFNEQHEILLGTRGSGKTAILKMLSYSCLRKLNHPDAEEYKKKKNYLGFYIPLHLEFISSLSGKEYPDNSKLQYFVFAFNCKAIKALLYEIPTLLEDCFVDPKERLLSQANILRHLSELWFPGETLTLSSISDLEWRIDCLYYNTQFWLDRSIDHPHLFATSLFWPLKPALTLITRYLNLDPGITNWFACVDEAEFLSEPFIQCINEFLRSEKKPIVIKLATLPFRHSTKLTMIPGVSVEGNGNDFNYRSVDLACDSNEFCNLTDHLCRVRLKKCDIQDPDLTLESFVGKCGNDDLIDYFKLEVPPEESTEEQILEGIVKSLSKTRQEKFKSIKNNRERVQSAFFKKFAPVYYMRQMKIANSQGNRTVGWFAGAPLIRRIADGNPRRFIQLMNVLFDEARSSELTPKNQHRINTGFCKHLYETSEGLPEFGLLLKGIINIVGGLLETRVHGAEMINSGYEFGVQKILLENISFRKTLELGIAYSVIFSNTETLFNGITNLTNFRLAHFIAVQFWLPMRKGEKVIINTKRDAQLSFREFEYWTPRTSKESNKLIEAMQLELISV